MLIRVLLGFAALVMAPALQAQTMGEASDDGDAFARQIRDATNDSILASGAENGVPGFEGTDVPGTDFLDDPDGLTAAGEAKRYDPDYQVVIDPYRTRFDPTTIDLSAATTIAVDPDAYIGGGFDADGAAGTCEPVPGGGTSDTEYLESCNAGSQPYDEGRICTAPLDVQTEGSNYWEYICHTEPERGVVRPLCDAIESDPQGGSCTITESVRVGETCLQWGVRNGVRWCTEPGDPIYRNTYSCPRELSVPGGIERNTVRVVSETVDETMCQSAVSDADCTLDTQVCIAPNETRVINGLSVTRECWEWERSYTCQGVRPANDCGELDAKPNCSFAYDECLSENADGTCNVYDRWYRCTAPGDGAEDVPAYICAEDLYCLNGECTQVEREASTEFKDAMVAVQAMGELRDDFNADNLTLFGGENLKCTKKLFGISNCCSGKGVPLITPFLCNSEDRDVDRKDDEGLCYKVGTYCSDKVLGVCVTKKQSYCCFSSKLVRILQVQGREQLGMEWGEPKAPDCEGFMVEEFQRLDLSLMDFTDVYAEFVDAAKIPDEVETSLMIQQRIDEYFDLHGGG
ncbi:MAG: conjugal transfer protein TraN [Alteraurantiacibacter sp.]